MILPRLRVLAAALSATFVVLAMVLAMPVHARPADLAKLRPVLSCASLAGLDLSAQTGSRTVLAATEISGDKPFCQIAGTIAPAIHFEVRLPVAGWTQRYLQTGCGGFCGFLRIDPAKADGCAPVTDGTIALASTDMGHQGMDMAWGEDPQKRIDFAYRGVHVTALAAKALIKAFYGQAARFAYFSGCSDGGREALIEAQRYPQDFDGIAAGAPALHFHVQTRCHHAWLARANTGADGKAILIGADMAPLHDAVLKACDGLDGLIDGQITDPRACHFNPATALCKGTYVPGQCLSADKVEAARLIYQGARTRDGKPLEVGPLLAGSEMNWIGVFVPNAAAGPMASAFFAISAINHLLFTPNPATPYTVQDFPFTAATLAQEEAARVLYGADNADLSAYAGHGGKLLMWHGWADPHISPLGTIDYYDRVGAKLGRDRRDGFVRLFLLPGMGHCSGGDGPSQFPLLAELMAWVEGGPAPQVMIAQRSRPTAAASQKPEPSARARPVFAYPAAARYRGSGPVDEAASFDKVTTTSKPAIRDWLGAR